MSFSLTWLPDVLEAAGLKVAQVDGWKTRGRAEMGAVAGVMCHTTVGLATGNMPSLGTLINGRTNLRGPLANLGLGRDGTYYVIAAGRANHAGAGRWRDIVTGNSSFVGIEGENTGTEPWPEIQMDAYRRGAAAILKHVGRSFEFCCAHREYALPPGRKVDPSFDMNDFRARVAAFIDGSTPAPPLIPAHEPAGEQRVTVRRGMQSALIAELQRKLNIGADGIFGAKTEAAVRAFQRARGIVPDGIVGPKTWQEIDRFG